MDSDSDSYSDADHTSTPVVRPARASPNILITGTPGTGKTTTCEMVAIATGLVHIEVGKLVKEKRLHDGFDESFQSYLINEDKVVDELEETMLQGGILVDHHGCDFFPERWFDLVVILTCTNDKLYERLENRGYAEKKIQENVDCEIMQVVAEEARESYEDDVIVEMSSNTVEEMEDNVNRIESWVAEFSQRSNSS